ncbi:MAG: lytic transglycosylase domain-containing protein, partial [Hyphomicrobiales bacterium]|nr:lytic transglycosylase domain-containing protein [Hyphomicrobiales bacterium]
MLGHRGFVALLAILLLPVGSAGTAHARDAADALDRLISRFSEPTPPKKPPFPPAERHAEATIPADHPKPPAKPDAPAAAKPEAAGPAAPAAVKVEAPGSLQDGIAAIRNGRIEEALAIRAKIKDATAGRLMDWLIIRSDDPAVTTRRIADFAASAPDWPIDAVIRRRAEQALARENAGADDILAAFAGSAPVSTEGTFELAGALMAKGDKNRAARLIREAYLDKTLSDADEATIISKFGSLLGPANHKARLDRLLYAERANQALRTAKRLGVQTVKLAEANVAVMRKAKNASAALDTVPAALQKDPVHLFARIQYLRRADKIKDAAKLMLSAPKNAALLGDPDEWWIERRLLTRELLDLNEPALAYKIAAGHSAVSPEDQVDAEFHAGWIALRFLDDPAKAEPHFARILDIAKGGRSRSRGLYWWGRAAAARGDAAAAKSRYQAAARHSSYFYGQLARAELGLKSIGLPGLPEPGPAAKARFAANDVVRGIALLGETGDIRLAYPLFRHLAETLSGKEEIVLLARLAEKYDSHNLALHVGILADQRDIGLDALAFPIRGIPKSAKIAAGIERPLVFAVARQESSFNPEAVSRAGARGLLQLLPTTAERTAKAAGLRYSRAQLTTDPAYNAAVGSAHLRELIDDANGSYILTFVGYNAGPRRIGQWIERYGDPRSPRVDAVDWIERIPFTETRNYV